MGPSVAGITLLFLLQCLCSGACIALLWLRMEHTGSRELSFLGWNLLLAWVPMVFAFLTWIAHRRRAPAMVSAALAAGWLLFLPNAPYIVTDIINLGHTWEHVPLWYDLVLLATFGGTGLLIGYSSLFLIQTVVAERMGAFAAWSGTLAMILLSSVGIYIGRILRLNSWDAFVHPGTLVSGLMRSRLTDPLGHPGLATLALAMTVILLSGYLVFFSCATTIQHHALRRESVLD